MASCRPLGLTAVSGLFPFLLSCTTSEDKPRFPVMRLNPNVSYPVPDAFLGEALQDGEEAAAKKIPTLIEQQIRKRFEGQRVLRDAHPKSHGCVNAEFAADPDIDPRLAFGVFSKGARYRAIVRYSNASGDPTIPDIKGDGRGMAVKLLKVPGKKLLDVESEATTQDFIMINHPVFFIADPEDYVSIIEKVGSSNVFAKLSILTTLGFKNTGIANAIREKQISSPIQTAYFSMVPYQAGTGDKRVAVRYKAEPCKENGADPIPEETDDAHYLRHRLKRFFETKDACFQLFAQIRTDESMSVEDSRDEWPSPWLKVASLTMKGKEQAIAENPGFEDKRNVGCDTLSFNPWHSLPEHRPLGAMNRMRKVIYEHISRVRHALNKETRKEP